MITVVVPVSPIKSHPDTAILIETIESARHHLPDAELVVTFDGVRAEQEDRRADYEEHIRRALWLLDHKYGNTVPIIHDQHMHQSGMMRHLLDKNIIRTPLLLYLEADCPLVTDEPIEFGAIANFIEEGYSNVVRLHHEAVIPDAHRHMIHGTEYGFIQTSQWSQRPHIASVAYYRRILETHFSPDARSFIEDCMHGVVDEAFRRDGMNGWMQHRLHIYNPGHNLKRSYHLDGRAGAAKYDETQVW